MLPQLAAIRRIAAFTEKQLELNDATRTDVALARSRVQEAEALRLRAQARAQEPARAQASRPP